MANTVECAASRNNETYALLGSSQRQDAAQINGDVTGALTEFEVEAGLLVAAGTMKWINSAAENVNAAKKFTADAARRPTTTILSDVTVMSRGKVVGRGDVYLRPTLEGIKSGKITPRAIFQNRERLLPLKPSGYYYEFVHPTPGVSGAGSQRIILGNGGELYYTPDHYGSFIPLN